MTDAPRDDPALNVARQCLARQREALRHDAKARQAEQALAHWGRQVNLPLLDATRSSHPLAQQLRGYIHRATRARRQRDELVTQLISLRATDARVSRVKLSLALALKPTTAEALTRSARYDLRAR